MELNSKLYAKLRAVLIETKKILCAPDSGGLTPRGQALRYDIEQVQEELHCLEVYNAKPKDDSVHDSVHERTYLYCHTCSFVVSCVIGLNKGLVTYCPNCKASLRDIPKQQCAVPKQCVFVGMMRPEWETLVKGLKVQSYGCSCGVNYISNQALLREHWQLGHFDWPVYKEV